MGNENLLKKTLLDTSSKFNFLMMIAGILIVTNIVTAIFVYYFYTEKYIKKSDTTAITKQVQFENNQFADGLENKEVKEETTDVKEDEFQPIEPDTTDGVISVDWRSDWPVMIEYYSVLDYGYIEKQLSHDEEFNTSFSNIIDFLNSFEIYQVGIIKDGPYAGDSFYLFFAEQQGMGHTLSVYRVIKDKDRLIILTKISSDLNNDFYKKIFVLNDDITISNIESPSKIPIPNSDISLLRNDANVNQLITKYPQLEKKFEYNDWSVYFDKQRGCFFVKAADFTVREYRLEIPFLTNKEEGFTSTAGSVPQFISFNSVNGDKISSEYQLRKMTGCGGWGYCYNYVDYVGINNLKLAGKTQSGDSLYILNDIDLKKSSTDEKSILMSVNDMYYPGENIEKKSFEEFINDYPLLYWQDIFGNFIEFTKAMYMPAVECGKPVIYLYPEETTDVHVEVKPTAGISISEPRYGIDGWQVRATLDSTIYNYADGKNYPYLFWEGYGTGYMMPDKGFVVPKYEVKNFLGQKLSQLGLNAKESDEFIEFWLPRMQEYKYYVISFIPKEQFDTIAPLTISPQPDTVIRVFMDYYGADNPVNVIEQILPDKPVRNGFTVVEWGGALNR